jgi:hypothetical protein
MVCINGVCLKLLCRTVSESYTAWSDSSVGTHFHIIFAKNVIANHCIGSSAIKEPVTVRGTPIFLEFIIYNSSVDYGHSPMQRNIFASHPLTCCSWLCVEDTCFWNNEILTPIQKHGMVGPGKIAFKKTEDPSGSDDGSSNEGIVFHYYTRIICLISRYL